jgi:tetratricopeptide (TPR) repeat protein
MTGMDSQQPPIVQNVTAVEGFAYGVIGADLHVFGNGGGPLYLLSEWRAEPQARAAWLRELPSRMLNARRAVVGFTGRDDELRQLHQWREDGGRLGVRWLHAPGGQGKTRLAAQFAAEAAEAGWKVVAAFHGPDADQPEPGSQDLRLHAAAGLLMIVDYADRWLLTNLTWLFKNAMLHQAGVPTRVLLIARTADAWPRVRAMLDGYQPDTSSQFLPGLAPESGERAEMFITSRDSFAVIYQLSGTLGIDPPGPLDGPGFGLTLAVHMAALVAVDARATGKRPPRDLAGLTVYLLDREQLHWARLYGDGAHTDETAAAYQTPPGAMYQVVFAAALTGTVPRSAALTLLHGFRLGSDTDRAVADHSACYPADDPDTALEPLYPDRLAEDLLALTLPGHQADYPAQPWAAATVDAVLARQDRIRAAQSWTPRAITFLAAAADRWPHLGPSHLYPLLRHDPRLAVDAGDAALTSIAGLADVDMAVLEAIESHLPYQRDVDIDTGIAALAQRLADHRLTATNDPAERARVYRDLAIRLQNAGLSERATRASQEAVDLYRSLAAADPGTFTAGLAASLMLLGRTEAGAASGGLAATREAADLYRGLARANPAAYKQELASSLSNLGSIQSIAGRRDDAFTITREAVDLYQELARANPVAFDAELGRPLTNLGTMLSDLGRRDEALAVTREAVELCRRLADANSSAHEPAFAVALTNLGRDLALSGRREEALAVTQQASDIYRRLATVNHAAFAPALGESLVNLTARMAEAGRPDTGLAAAREAVDLYRQLTKTDKAAHEPRLGESLVNLSMVLTHLGRLQDALTAVREAAKLFRQFAAADPTAYEPRLAASLTNLATLLTGTGQAGESLPVAREAVAISRRLVQANPAAFEPSLGKSLISLSTSLAELRQRDEALAVSHETIELYRRLAFRNQAAFEPDLAGALIAHAMIRLILGAELIEAFSSIRMSVSLLRGLAKALPGVFTTQLAAALGAAADLLDELRRPRDAQTLRQLTQTQRLDEAARFLQQTPQP